MAVASDKWMLNNAKQYCGKSVVGSVKDAGRISKVYADNMLKLFEAEYIPRPNNICGVNCRFEISSLSCFVPNGPRL